MDAVRYGEREVLGSEFSDHRASAFNLTIARQSDAWLSLVGLVRKFRYTQTNRMLKSLPASQARLSDFSG